MEEEQKIAIVYDWIDSWGGIERVLLVLKELFPGADWYSSYVDINKAKWAKDLSVHTSFMQHLPSWIKNNRALSVPFFPYAFESFCFNRYDTVISVSSAFAKSIITKPSTRHIAYLLTPPRFLYGKTGDYLSSPMDSLFSSYVDRLRQWDKVASARPDSLLSISQTVKDRCFRYYDRDSTVVYPPFDKEYWAKVSKEKSPLADNVLRAGAKKYYLVVSRLARYKKIEITIDAINNRLSDTLVIVGEGPMKNSLQREAKSNVIFLGHVSDHELAFLYSRADALIMPQEEDFGLVSLEGQFFDCPVIAFKKGGATETVEDGTTGLFFQKQTAESLAETLERYAAISYNLKIGLKKEKMKVFDKFAKEKFKNFFKHAVLK
ncbi:glycosyltransferase [Candidatus Roizmanbacteria bacterium]|nr:glycosyltransferase [Candidatus Roizmanbacteria bacterium]